MQNWKTWPCWSRSRYGQCNAKITQHIGLLISLGLSKYLSNPSIKKLHNHSQILNHSLPVKVSVIYEMLWLVWLTVQVRRQSIDKKTTQVIQNLAIM